MLNELHEASLSLAAAGVDVGLPDRLLTKCKKSGVTLRVLLGPGGDIPEVQEIADADLLSRTYTFFKGENSVSFPVFNVPPLYCIDSKVMDALKASQNAPTRSAIEVHCSRPSWPAQKAKWIGKCLGVMPADLMSKVGEVPSEFAALGELCLRARKLETDSFCEGLRAALVSALAAQRGDREKLLGCLFHVKRPNVRPSPFQVVLDVPDWEEFPAWHEKVQQWVRQRLMVATEEAATSATDAYGKPASGLTKKMPLVDLPIIGRTRIRTMTKESPCQTRYGRTESDSFPVGQRTRDGAQTALKWLAASDRKGKTWESASGTCGHTKKQGKRVPVAALVLAYPSVLPGNASEKVPEIVPLFVGQTTGDPDGAVFEKCAERVIAALSGLAKAQPDAEIRVFVLVKADKARTKVLLSRNYRAVVLMSAAQAWQDGCVNLPLIRMDIGAEARGAPLVPFPSEVVKCLNLAWVQGGTHVQQVHGLSIGDGISLLVESGPRARDLAGRAMRLAVANGGPLLLAVGHADHRRDKRPTLGTGWDKHARLLPSILGLLLSKLGHRKGGYMHGAPFLVGKMLSLADTLHMQYCLHIRKKQVPPQLVGNALMTAAQDNPEAGMARLSERLHVYQAWARTAQGEETRLAKWALGQLGGVSAELARLGPLPTSPSDADKAQMLLGYLARAEGNKPEQEKEEENDEIQGQ